jgi:hypothetical protein
MRTLIDQNQQVFIEVSWLEDKKIIHANWIGSYLSVDQVKQGGFLILEEIKNHQCVWLMTDNRQLEGVWDEANDWIANEWIPQAVEAGLLKLGHILSGDLYAQLSAEFMDDNVQKMENTFQFKMFNSQDAAEHWLTA